MSGKYSYHTISQHNFTPITNCSLQYYCILFHHLPYLCIYLSFLSIISLISVYIFPLCLYSLTILLLQALPLSSSLSTTSPFLSFFMENSVFRKVLFLVAFVCCFQSLTPHFFTINIQDTSTKLSGIICRPPEQIKFEYHDSNSLQWLEKSKITHFQIQIQIQCVQCHLDPWTA